MNLALPPSKQACKAGLTRRQPLQYAHKNIAHKFKFFSRDERFDNISSIRFDS